MFRLINFVLSGIGIYNTPLLDIEKDGVSDARLAFSLFLTGVFAISLSISSASKMFVVINFLIFGSIIAQIPGISDVIANTSRLLWLAAFAVLLLNNRKQLFQIRYFRFFLCSILAITAYVAICSVSSQLYLQSPAFHLLFPAFIGYSIGCCLPKYMTEKQCSSLLIMYFVYACLLVLNYIASNFASVNDFLSVVEYWYQSKNSMARIIGAGALIFLFLPFQKQSVRYLSRGMGLLFIVIIFILRSRASLLGVLIAMIYHMLRKRQYFRVALLLTASLLWMSDTMRDFSNKRYDDLEVEQAFVIRSLRMDRFDDIDRFSGGRLALFSRTVDLIEDNFLVGVGKCEWPVDNFYLSVTAQLGILGALMFLGIVLYRLLLNLIYHPRQFADNGLVRGLELITVMNLVVSFFEGGGMLGPGNVSLSLWLLSGYFDARHAMGRPEETCMDNALPDCGDGPKSA